MNANTLVQKTRTKDNDVGLYVRGCFTHGTISPAGKIVYVIRLKSRAFIDSYPSLAIDVFNARKEIIVLHAFASIIMNNSDNVI